MEIIDRVCKINDLHIGDDLIVPQNISIMIINNCTFESEVFPLNICNNNLKELYINFSKLSEIPDFSNHKNLELLDLSNNNLITFIRY